MHYRTQCCQVLRTQKLGYGACTQYGLCGTLAHMETETVTPTWTLEDRLGKARRHAGLAQADLAKYIGVSKRAISAFETGTRKPRLGFVRLWAECCGVPLEWLIEDPDVKSRWCSLERRANNVLPPVERRQSRERVPTVAHAA